LDLHGPRKFLPPPAAVLQIVLPFAPYSVQSLLLKVIEMLLQFLVFARAHIAVKAWGRESALFAFWSALRGRGFAQEPTQETAEETHQYLTSPVMAASIPISSRVRTPFRCLGTTVSAPVGSSWPSSGTWSTRKARQHVSQANRLWPGEDASCDEKRRTARAIDDHGSDRSFTVSPFGKSSVTGSIRTASCKRQDHRHLAPKPASVGTISVSDIEAVKGLVDRLGADNVQELAGVLAE
jgi:hypothetical protein